MDANSHARFLEERMSKYKEKLQNQSKTSATTTNASASTNSAPSINVFSNDGSFMDQFRKLSGSKSSKGDNKQTGISKQSKDLLQSKSHTYRAMLEAKQQSNVARKGTTLSAPIVKCNPLGDDSDEEETKIPLPPGFPSTGSKSISQSIPTPKQKYSIGSRDSQKIQPSVQSGTGLNSSSDVDHVPSNSSTSINYPLGKQHITSDYGTPHSNGEPSTSKYKTLISQRKPYASEAALSEYGTPLPPKQEASLSEYGSHYPSSSTSMSEYGSCYPSTTTYNNPTSSSNAASTQNLKEEYDPFAPTDDGDINLAIPPKPEKIYSPTYQETAPACMTQDYVKNEPDIGAIHKGA